jgi:hypothetical protein
VNSGASVHHLDCVPDLLDSLAHAGMFRRRSSTVQGELTTPAGTSHVRNPPNFKLGNRQDFRVSSVSCGAY